MYSTKPRLFTVLGRITFTFGLAGLCGGVILASMQPLILDAIYNSSGTGLTPEIVWWEKLIDSVKSKDFLPITLIGIAFNCASVIAAYGILNPGKIAWHWILLILLSTIAWSMFYIFIGTFFNIISLGVYGLTFLYLCRPKVRAYFWHLDKTATNRL